MALSVEELTEKFRKIGIIPVVVMEDAENAEALSDALCEGGLPCAEVTFRTEAAAESIRRMKERHPEMLLGAGTVLTMKQADRAKEAGAEFLVSPGLNPVVVRHAQLIKVPMIPGTLSPSEMEAAMGLGLSTVKFFPAEPAGGLAMLKAIGSAYVNLSFMPTGGLNGDNVREYLAWDRIVACGGSWMVKKDWIREKEFDRIRETVREAAEIVREVRG